MNADPPTHQFPDPLATPGLVRFFLGKTASSMLESAGEFFLIEAKRSPHPEHDGRFVAYALPTTKEKADAAAKVAKGEVRIVAAAGKSSPKNRQSKSRSTWKTH